VTIYCQTCSPIQVISHPPRLILKPHNESTIQSNNTMHNHIHPLSKVPSQSEGPVLFANAACTVWLFWSYQWCSQLMQSVSNSVHCELEQLLVTSHPKHNNNIILVFHLAMKRNSQRNLSGRPSSGLLSGSAHTPNTRWEVILIVLSTTTQTKTYLRSGINLRFVRDLMSTESATVTVVINNNNNNYNY